ncbi:MAG: ATP-binding protein, partial [Candidatus Omnitrophica bacterium]|nr:ATP-binding protein [Candidatus Omnitrophota bacterium]
GEKALKKNNLLRSAVLYGANASGKSNVLKAFANLKYLIITSNQNIPGQNIRFLPFKLDEKCLSKPSKFNINFVQGGIRYNYKVSFTSEKVIDESLYYYPKGAEATIFERNDTIDYKFTIDKSKQKGMSERTLENVFYLSNSAQQNYDKTLEPFKWFLKFLDVIGPTEKLDKYATVKLMEKDEKLKNIVLKGLVVADLGISNLNASIKEISPDDFSNLPEDIRTFIDSSHNKIDNVNQIDSVNLIDLKFFHNGFDEKHNKIGVQFDIEEESDGTQKLFSLIGPWINSLNHGSILVIDELDSNFHPFLCKYLIDMFNNPEINISNSQLLFTTHNSTFLDQDIFRRDQIWFTEKDAEFGNTNLFSLLEFKQRKDVNIEKGYLAGRYGAVPFIKSVESVFS